MKINLNTKSVLKALKKVSSPDKAKILQRFFKTGKGQYGAGDVFMGVMVPEQRAIAKSYQELPLSEVQLLLDSKFHEARLTGLIILVLKYKNAETEKEKKVIFDFYIKNLARVNNWDLVDVTTPNIVGEYLLTRPKVLLYKLAKSKNLWERRVSMLACFTFIKNHQFDDVLKIAKTHLGDGHDLMHKAVGWMLREVGKRDEMVLKKFLKENYSKLPRTALRYAIERFPEEVRKDFLNGIKK